MKADYISHILMGHMDVNEQSYVHSFLRRFYDTLALDFKRVVHVSLATAISIPDN